MDYTQLEKEFDLILEKPLWMRPIAPAILILKTKEDKVLYVNKRTSV
jgi:hypothetical protein